MLNLLASLDKPTEGEILLDEKSFSKIKQKQLCAFRRDNLGFVFQIPTLLGVLFLGGEYYIALISKVDSMIFVAFFLAVLMVVVGTYFLFTSESITLLRALRKNKKFYYKQSNIKL